MKLTEVFTLKEIEEKYKIKTKIIKDYLNAGADELKEGIDYKKSGDVWLITRKAIEKKFDIVLHPEDDLFI